MEVDKVGWVTEKRLAEMTGLTRKALERKRQREVFREGVYRKIDGRIMYNVVEFNRWASN